MIGINNINALAIFQNDTKYVFLGDIHVENDSPCENTIGVKQLLKYWFEYNERHDISTDFYAEVNYTKSNKRKIIEHGSPLQLLPQWLPCFDVDKSCFVHAHYMNIRAVDVDGIVISIDPFDLLTLMYVMDRSSPEQIIKHKQDIIKLIKVLKSNYMDILNGLLQPQLQTLNKYKNLFRPYANVFKHIEEHAVIRDGIKMFRVAAELLRLKSFNVSLANRIEHYIYRKAELTMAKVSFDEELSILDVIDYLPKHEINEALNNVLTQINNKLLPLGALVMDMYVLSRMFLYESKEVVVYAGSSHISNYIEFFVKVLKMKPSFLILPSSNQCLVHPLLTRHLDINLYQNDI